LAELNLELQLVGGLLDILWQAGLGGFLYPHPYDTSSMICAVSRNGVRVDAQFNTT
jgi:hypothetical protein